MSSNSSNLNNINNKQTNDNGIQIQNDIQIIIPMQEVNHNNNQENNNLNIPSQSERKNLKNENNEDDLDEILNFMASNPNIGNLSQENFFLLLEMGYDVILIRKVYLLLEPRSLEEAIQLMTRIGDIIQHEFYPSSLNESACFICGDLPENHIGYIPPVQNSNQSIIKRLKNSFITGNNNSNLAEENVNSQNKNKDNVIIKSTESLPSQMNNTQDNMNYKKNKTLKECLVCMETLTLEQFEKNSLTCKHAFCDQCWFEYIKEKITSGNIDQIKCMESTCTLKPSKDFIMSRLEKNEDLKTKYNDLEFKQTILKNQNAKFCPYPDCNSYGERKNPEEKYIKCKNGHEFCFICLKPWHGTELCQKNIDKDFYSWKKNKYVKKCPKCGMWIEKNEGCNHMTCIECHYQWCWICGGKYTSDHFGPGGTCYGLQFTKQNSCLTNCFVLFLYKLLIYLVKFILSFLITGIFTILCAGMKFLDHYTNFHGIENFFPILTFVNLGIIFQPIFSLVCSPILFVTLFYPPLLSTIFTKYVDLVLD